MYREQPRSGAHPESPREVDAGAGKAGGRSGVCNALHGSLVLAQGGRGRAGKAKDKGPGPCDRACLEGFVNQYLDAPVAHNPFGLPLAARVKFSENDQLLDLGCGT